MSNQPVGVGIIGAGRPNVATTNQIPACQQSSTVRLVALCDKLESVHEVARKAQCKAYTDYEQMLADPDVEMVQVATPDWCHVDHAEAALQNGRHVLLQKPPCVNMAGLQRLRRAVRRSRCRLKVLLNTRHRRLSRTVRRELEAGRIGSLVHVRISYRGHRFPIEDPQSPYLKAAMGGVWIHNGLHWLDEATFYGDGIPEHVHVVAARHDNGPPAVLGEGPNYWHGRFVLTSGVTVALEYNAMLMRQGLPGGMQRILVGTEGEIRQEYDSETVQRCRIDDEAWTPCPTEHDRASSAEDVTDSFRRAIDDFASEIRHAVDKPPMLTHSFACMEALIAGAQHANRRAVALPELREEDQAQC